MDAHSGSMSSWDYLDFELEIRTRDGIDRYLETRLRGGPETGRPDGEIVAAGHDVGH